MDGAWNKNLRPVLISALWRGNVVSNLLTFGHWKVVFSLFLILYRAFPHLMYLRKFKFQGLHHKMYKIKLFHCCDVVPNPVVEIEIFNFGLFVCLLVCLYLAFCQFCKRKMVQLWFQKLFWNQGCGVVSNLFVEIAIYNFNLFHTALDTPVMTTRAPVVLKTTLYMEKRINENDLTSASFTSPPSETCRIKIERICPAIAFLWKVIGASVVFEVLWMIKLRWWSANREQAHRTACLWKERPHKSRQNCTSRTCAVPNHV